MYGIDESQALSVFLRFSLLFRITKRAGRALLAPPSLQREGRISGGFCAEDTPFAPLGVQRAVALWRGCRGQSPWHSFSSSLLFSSLLFPALRCPVPSSARSACGLAAGLVALAGGRHRAQGRAPVPGVHIAGHGLGVLFHVCCAFAYFEKGAGAANL